MSLWKDLKARLGLEEDYDDEYYEDDDEVDGYEPPAPRSPYEGEPLSVRRVHREPDLDRAREQRRESALTPGPGMHVVPQVKMKIVEPRTYSEAQSIADTFKLGVPVIMNLTMTDVDLAKRLIDFASGLTYALNGGLQKVSDKVFMLTPANVDVSAEQRRTLRDKGLLSLDG